MIEVTQFRPEHLTALKLQATQASAQPLMTIEHGQEVLAATGIARTVLIDGEPIMCAGLMELWTNRAFAWSYLAEHAKRHFRACHRVALENLAASRWRRVEMTVDVRDPAAKRWAKHLGFSFEGVHRAWTTDGRDVEMWARLCKH